MERTLRNPSPELRAASAAGVVRAGGDANLADLYVLFKDSDPRPSLASLRELEHLKTDESTKLVARLVRRPQPDVEKLAADILFSAGRATISPRSSPPRFRRPIRACADARHRGRRRDPAFAGRRSPAGDLGLPGAPLRGEPDLAADWFVGYGTKLPPAAQAEAMATGRGRTRRPPRPPPHRHRRRPRVGADQPGLSRTARGEPRWRQREQVGGPTASAARPEPPPYRAGCGRSWR